jgi:hypothetical protein
MMPDLRITFNAEVVEEQRQLDGSRYVAVEGADDSDGAWFLMLTFGQAKSPETELTEGDLTLTGPDGVILAGLESGHADIVNDDADGDEQEVFDLMLRANGGEGKYAEIEGLIRLRAELLGTQGSIRLETEEPRGPV